MPEPPRIGRQPEGAAPATAPQILVIRLSALGNLVMSFRAFAAIRQHHHEATITLLTTAPYAEWMAASPWFDRVLVDTRPAWWDLPGVLRLRRQLRGSGFARVYDLQTSRRSSRYFRLFPRRARPEWSGTAPGCSHPDNAPGRVRMHDIERQYSQLRQAGVTGTPPAALDWCHGDAARFALPRPFVLLVPGSAPHRPVKRWPAAHYRALALELARRGLTPVVLGSAVERKLAQQICTGTPARDLAGETSFGDLADLGRAAAFAVGNDTGPMHLLAAAGCPSLVLFSRDTDPARFTPREPAGALATRVLRRDDLADLPVAEVIAALAPLLAAASRPAPAGQPAPATGPTVPASGQTTPATGQPVPASGQTVPASGQTMPASGQTMPASGQTVPASGQTMPASGLQTPAAGVRPSQPAPAGRGSAAAGAPA